MGNQPGTPISSRVADETVMKGTPASQDIRHDNR